MFKPLSERPQKGVFRCGKDEIDQWFYKRAYQEHETLKSRVTTFHLKDTDELVGYHCLSMAMEDERLLDNIYKPRVRSLNQQFISLRADYIAVGSAHQGIGIGKTIFGNAVDIFHDTVKSTGIPVMTLICIDRDKVDFYKKFGFLPYGKDILRPRMLLPARDVIKAYQQQSENEHSV